MALSAPRPHWALIEVMLLWVVTGWSPFATGQSAGVAIVYHEPLADLHIRARAERGTFAKPTVAGQPDLAFSAFGRNFELVLERNDNLLRRLTSVQPSALESVELYRGRLIGAPGSWVRISQAGNRISGLIFDGVEYYAIDSLEQVADKLVMPAVDTEGTVIYRLYDTTGLVHDETFELVAPTGERAAAQKSSVLPSFMAGVVLGQQIDIGVVGDVEFAERVGASNSLEKMLELINVVDGIFLEGLGVHINLVEVESYGAEPDPFTTANPGLLLDEVGHFKDTSAAFRPLGLLHLFTGRDLEESTGSSQILGVANVGVLCEPRSGVAVTQSRGGVSDAIVAAHEIGHNFGAPHDAEPGSVCQAAPPGMLMDASLNGSTEFSQCSIEQMQIEIAGASCLTPLLPANLILSLRSIAPPSVVEPDVPYEFDIAIENTSGVDAVDVSMVMNAPSMHVGGFDFSGARPDDCDRPIINQPYRCYWSELAAGERFEATLFFRPTTSGPATVDLGITSLTEFDTTGDNLHFEVDVLPYVNLTATIEPQALSLRPDEQGTVTLTARNIGQIPANDVVVRVAMREKLDFVGATVACALDSDSYFVGYDCPIGTLAPGESVQFSVDFQPKPGLSSAEIKAGTSIGASVSSLEPEQVIDRGDNSASARVTLGDSIGDLVIEQFALPTAYVGETITAVVDVRNDGPDTIHDVQIELVVLAGSAQPTLIGLTGVPCALPTTDSVPFCEIPQLAAGEELSLTFSIATSSTGDAYFSIGGATSSSDRNSFNDNDTSYVRVLTRPAPPSPPPPPDPAPAPAASSGGGGGGAFDLLTLLFLGLLSAAAQRPTVLRRWSTVRS